MEGIVPLLSRTEMQNALEKAIGASKVACHAISSSSSCFLERMRCFAGARSHAHRMADPSAHTTLADAAASARRQHSRRGAACQRDAPAVPVQARTGKVAAAFREERIRCPRSIPNRADTYECSIPPAPLPQACGTSLSHNMAVFSRGVDLAAAAAASFETSSVTIQAHAAFPTLSPSESLCAKSLRLSLCLGTLLISIHPSISESLCAQSIRVSLPDS